MALIAECVSELAALAGGGCLVETPDGLLIAHKVLADKAPSLIVSAVMTGSVAGLHAGLSGRHTTGMLLSVPIVEAQLSEQRTMYVPLRDGEIKLGGVWLLTLPSRQVRLVDLQVPIQRLSQLLSCTSDGPEMNCLEGGPLPHGIGGAERLWVTRLLSDTPATNLRHALVLHSKALALHPVQCGQNVYVVAAGSRQITTERAQVALQAMCEAAASTLGLPVTGGMSALLRPADLASGRLQADAAASAAPAGTCAPLTQVRAALVVREMGAALDRLPDLGSDPLQALVDYDLRRSTHLVETLRAWLDVFGDAPQASAALGIHGNTLRYRLGRITEILGVDPKTDPHVRAALHVQLLTRNRLPLAGSATSSPG